MEKKPKEYVLGFAFDEKRTGVVLIKKTKPDWQAGKFNGVGGKVEEGEGILKAMIREFHEETGVITDSDNWRLFARMVFQNDIMGGGAVIHVFRGFFDISNVQTMEEEEIHILGLRVVYNRDLMHNLHILIPLALQKEFNYTELKQF